MTNTEYTHFQDVYPVPSERRSVQQPLGGVGQDKGAHSRARIASLPIAPPENMMRAQQLKTDTPRSQSRPNTKRKTTHLTLWVKPVVKAELERIAERERLSVSATGAAFLERAMQTNVDMQYGALFQPIMEQLIRKHMRSISTHLAWLLVRVAFDCGQTRSLVTNILSRQPGMTQDELKNILDGSNKTARGNITRRTPQIIELIDAVEEWMMKEEEGRADA
jgi:hypothetical protein